MIILWSIYATLVPKSDALKGSILVNPDSRRHRKTSRHGKKGTMWGKSYNYRSSQGYIDETNLNHCCPFVISLESLPSRDRPLPDTISLLSESIDLMEVRGLLFVFLVIKSPGASGLGRLDGLLTYGILLLYFFYDA